MMKNNKGVTIVELVVSMTVLIIIVTFLFQMIISLKEIYNSSGIKTELLNKQAIISKMINEDFNEKGIEMALACSSYNDCLSLYFKDGTTKQLKISKKTDNEPAYFTYGDYKTSLNEGTDFGSYKIETTTLFTNSGLLNDSLLVLDIPIKNNQLKNEDFGINIVYQYNSSTSSITDLSIGGNSSASSIWLAGSSNMIWYTTVDFIDPGYYYLDENDNLIKATSSTDAVTVTRSKIENNVMTITYQNSDASQTVTRTVSFIPSSYSYSVNNASYTFTVPVTGVYKIEAWGASGSPSLNNAGGQGAYTSGLISLNANEKLYIYVGSTGNGDNGGYNGGGSITLNQSKNGGAPGGGATDIRLRNGVWDTKDSLISRIMVAAGGGGASSSTCGSSLKTGGNGGNIVSSSFSVLNNCSDGLWTIAYGANQTSGGSLDIYDVNGSKLNTYIGGEFGFASTPKEYEEDILSGGGGGYCGGTNSGYGSPGTGGSSFVSGCQDCIAMKSDGTPNNTNIHYSGKTFTNIVMNDSPSSNPSGTADGFAKITLVSVSNVN